MNGFPAAAADFQAQTQDGQALVGRVVFLSFGGSTYRLLGYGTATAFAAQRSAVLQAIQTFGRLTDQAALARQPLRVKMVRLTKDMTVDDFSRQYPSGVPVATLAFINGVGAAADVLKSGTWARRIQ